MATWRGITGAPNSGRIDRSELGKTGTAYDVSRTEEFTSPDVGSVEFACGEARNVGKSPPHRERRSRCWTGEPHDSGRGLGYWFALRLPHRAIVVQIVDLKDSASGGFGWHLVGDRAKAEGRTEDRHTTLHSRSKRGPVKARLFGKSAAARQKVSFWFVRIRPE